MMDPQQRQLLERGYESYRRIQESHDVVGVCVGMESKKDIAALMDAVMIPRSVYQATGTSIAIASGRLSHTLDLHGPCCTIDTTCSSSLVATHLARNALLLYECTASLAAGVNAILAPSVHLGVATVGIMSIRGRAFVFDSRADGYARSEACAANTLVINLPDETFSRRAPLSTASMVRQDGKSASLTSPNGVAQQMLLLSIRTRSSCGAPSIIEAAANGSALGDPIEANSTLRALLPSTDDFPLVLHNIKGTVGHSEPASGVVGVAKLALELWQRQMPPNSQLKLPSEHVSRTMLGVDCVLPSHQLLIPPERRHGGVCSFGFSGTLAHVALSVYQIEQRPAQVFRLGNVFRRRFKLPSSEFTSRAGARCNNLVYAPVIPAQIVRIVHTLTGVVTESQASLGMVGMDSISVRQLELELRQLCPTLPSSLLLKGSSISDLAREMTLQNGVGNAMQRNEAQACQRLPTEMISVFDIISSLNAINAFVVVLWHFLPACIRSSSFNNGVFSYSGIGMDFFITSSGFTTEALAPNDILNHGYAYIQKFLHSKVSGLYVHFVLAMAVSAVLGRDGWYVRDDASVELLVGCFTTVRWYLPFWRTEQSGGWCPNTVSWTIGTLFFCWLLFPFTQAFVRVLERRWGATGIVGVTFSVNSLLNYYVFPFPRPYAFPPAYFLPFVCGVGASRLIKMRNFEPSQTCQTTRNEVQHEWVHSPVISRWSFLLADAAFALCFFLPSMHLGNWMGAPAIAVSLFLFSASTRRGVSAWLLAHKPLPMLGSCSLEIFLFQAPAWAVLTWLFDMETYHFERDRFDLAYSSQDKFIAYIIALYLFAGVYAAYMRQPIQQFVLNLAHLLWIRSEA